MANRVLVFDSEPTDRKSEAISCMQVEKNCMCVFIHVRVYIRIYIRHGGFFISSHH